MAKYRIPWHPRIPSEDYLTKHYGITRKEWKELYDFQGGMCAVCGSIYRPLMVDHDHRGDQPKRDKHRKKKGWTRKGTVRGLLCWMCNTALQAFRHNAVEMRSGAEYITQPSAWDLWPAEERVLRP